MKRPFLHSIPLASATIGKPGSVTITMSPGQWDLLLATAYSRGCLLLEIENEVPVRAYQKPRTEN